MKYLAIFILSIGLLNSCAKTTQQLALAPIDHTEIDLSQNLKAIIGLASPIQLEKGENIIDLTYYFHNSQVDSVVFDQDVEYILDAKHQRLQIQLNTRPSYLLANMTCYVEGESYDIMIKSPRKQRAYFKLVDAGYTDVKVKGEMNSWNPGLGEMTKRDDTWSTTFDLNPGNYQYKFVVDGNELNDPNPEVSTVSNGSGGFNSLYSIKKPSKDELPWLITSSHNDSEVTFAIKNGVTRVYSYVDNVKVEHSIVGDLLSISLPMWAKAQKRTTLRCVGYNAFGLTNDVEVQLEYGKVLQSAADVIRSDYEAQIMYFTLVDRFNNGDLENDDPVQDDRLKPLTNYMGGDLAGITTKIQDGYFDSLQINSIWLSPITQNPLDAYQEYIDPQYYYSGYHGYWPISSSRVDHRFGNEEDLRELVKVAHDNDINILLDYVTNHVHEEHPMYQQHPDWATDLILPNGERNLRIWDEQRLTTWFDTFMPSLDLSNPEVIAAQVDSTMYWIKHFGLDGYRHDATKHIPEAFWKELTKRLKLEVMDTQARSLYQIGETYGSRELIKSYMSTGMLDAQFDFNLYFDAREVFALDDVGFEKLATSLEETFSYYGYHSTMGYISGNHDQARFTSLASGDVRFDEDQKMAGFNRAIGVTDLAGYDKMQMLFAFIMTIPGVPVIYYGDEIGMAGAGDPDSRRMMRFENLAEQEAETKAIVKALTALRRNFLPLIYGHTTILEVSEQAFVYSRQYFEDEAIVLFNKSNEVKEITVESDRIFKGNFEGQISRVGKKYLVELEPYSFEVLTTNE